MTLAFLAFRLNFSKIESSHIRFELSGANTNQTPFSVMISADLSSIRVWILVPGPASIAAGAASGYNCFISVRP